MKEKRIRIYTYGDDKGNAIALFGNRERFYHHQEDAVQLESDFNAVRLALHQVDKDSKVDIYTSTDVVKGYLGENWKITFEFLKSKVDRIKDLVETKGLDVKYLFIPRDENIAGLVLRRHLMKQQRRKVPGSEK